MRKLSIGLAAACLVLAAPAAAPAQGTCVFVTVGATMTLTGDCITDATIEIPDGFTLDGDGHTITAVDPPGGHFVGGVIENAGAVAHVTDVTVTAAGLADVCDAGADRLRGILFVSAHGSITNTAAIDINQGQSGCQEGNGIEVRNAPFDGTHPATKTVVIAGNVVAGYQKNGITANGDVEAEVDDNVVTGAGPVDYIAQNGIQFGFGAIGSASGNAVSGNDYTPSTFFATGILIFAADPRTHPQVTRAENTVFANEIDIFRFASSSARPFTG